MVAAERRSARWPPMARRFLLDDVVDGLALAQGQPLTLHRQKTDLTSLVQGIVDSYAAMSDAYSIRVSVSESPLYGHWDPLALSLVIDNLVSNAMKYSPDGGSIQVSVGVNRTKGDRYAVLRVQDGGVGIPESDVSRLFEPFFRGSNVEQRIRGTGIGLHSAKQVVEQHGGSIEVQSQLNAGTTVTVRLPLASWLSSSMRDGEGRLD